MCPIFHLLHNLQLIFLMTMVKSSVLEEEAIKSLYDVSVIIRNNLNGLKLFYSESGDLMLQVMHVAVDKSKSFLI